jgi:hypothetical protein
VDGINTIGIGVDGINATIGIDSRDVIGGVGGWGSVVADPCASIISRNGRRWHLLADIVVRTPLFLFYFPISVSWPVRTRRPPRDADTRTLL